MTLWRASAQRMAQSWLPLVLTLLAAAVALPASGREHRLAGAPGPAGELAQQERAHDRLGAADALLRIELPPAPQRIAKAKAQAVNEVGPQIIGFHRDLPEAHRRDLLADLEWATNSGGELAATLLVSSPQAKSIRLALRADLPPGGALRFFNPGGETRNVLLDPVVTQEDLREHSMPAGAPGASRPGGEGRVAGAASEPDAYWSPSVRGEVIGVEITLPSDAARQQASLRLEKIAHRFASAEVPLSHLDRGLNCRHIDVQCRTDRFRSGLEDATVRLEFEKPPFTAMCTGTLLNDSNPNTFEPYVLTAEHCLTTPAVARTVQARWFYQRAGCGGADVRDARTATTFGGADLLVALEADDVSLIRLRRRIPPNVYFSGWDTTPRVYDDAVYGIHHPAGAAKKYSAGNIRIFGRNRPLRESYGVVWSEGTIEGGSSGSGLFYDDLLIGALSASGGGRCDSLHFIGFYGTFKSVFSQVCPYLAPESCDTENASNSATTAATIGTSPSPLTEANLDNATVTVSLTNTSFAGNVTKDSFTLATDVPGLAIEDLISTVAAGDKLATLRLGYDGTDFDTARTLSVTVPAAAHHRSGDLASATVPVSPGLDATASRTTLSLNESPGGTNANVGTYTVVLDQVPAAMTTVAVRSSDTSAVAVSPASLTFTTTNWNTAQMATATAQQDDDMVDESVRLIHSETTAGTVATVTVSVTDDDAGTVLLDADPTTEAQEAGPLALEEGSSGAYAVRLSAQPTGNVTAAVASGDTAVTVGTASLTFTTNDWDTAQTVTATAQGDADALDESVTLAHTASGGGYNGTATELRVAVSDDERTGTDYDADEDGLIEIASLAQLNAVRWDLDGNGAVAAGDSTSYGTAFPGASAGMGCPAGAGGTATCTGYELTADLDFDTDGDGATHADGTSDSDDDYHNDGSGWDPIGPATAPSDTTHYNATFDGNGHTIFNLFVNRSRNNSGLFAAFGSSAKVTSLGLADAHVQGAQEGVGTLVGQNSGRISAAWATGSASGAGGVGGLVGIALAGSTIVASYSRASVACTGTGASRAAGGLAASNAGVVAGSYVVGAVTSSTCPQGNLHGLTSGGTAATSYWNLQATVATSLGNGLGQTAGVLQTPTSATGIYDGWARLDLDGDGDPSEAPWDFGTSGQYPVLLWRGMDPVLQRGDYDSDDDGLIEVRDLAQLNAIRWDSDGNGAPSNAVAYEKAFRHHRADMGCPTTTADADDNDCAGYELAANLDFDTDGDGSTHRGGSGDSGDAYYNGGAGFEPIQLDATFKGNGHTIANLFINRGSRFRAALFGLLDYDHRIESVGLLNVYVRGNQTAGALVGYSRGTIATSYSTGQVIAGAQGYAGGLVGYSSVTLGDAPLAIVASYSLARVSGRFSGGVAGTVHDNGAGVSASYAAGPVTGNQSGGFVGPLSHSAQVTFTGVYYDSIRSRPRFRFGVGSAKTTQELQAPTGPTGIYAAWDDVDVDDDGVVGAAADADDDVWAFGRSNQYPVLKVANFDTALQFNFQPNQRPAFRATVTNKTYDGGVPITPFQIPVASGGNGAISYSATGLPAGLALDADGTGSCGVARTICGTPSSDGVATVTITAADEDNRTSPADEATLTFTITVWTPTAAVGASPWPLTEGNLHGATLTVALVNTTFGSGVTRGSFTLATDVPGLSIGSLAPVARGATLATLTLAYGGADFDTARTLSVTVASSAHVLAGNLTTGTVSVAPALDVTTSRTTLSLHENPGTTNANVGTYTVVLDAAPMAATTVTVASADAAVTVDTAGSQNTLTFTPQNWNTPQTVTATAQQDDDTADESVVVTHATSGGGNLATVMVAVTDDDVGMVLIDADPETDALDPGPLALAEAATAADTSKSYRVRLSTVPTGNATVAVASGDPAAATASASALVFTPQNWNAPQTVTAAAVQDADGVDEAVVFTHTASGGGYNGTAARLRVTVADDERTGTDYDVDEDGLVEIASLAQLNAVRWDLDGNGAAAAGDATSYATAFPSASAGMGCPAVGGSPTCSGYELTADLDFDTDGDGATHSGGASDSGDDYHNGGSGWDPIGPATAPSDATRYNAIFDGNGHTIFNLFVNRSRDNSGLFAALGSGARVRALGLVDAHVRAGMDAVGTLAGTNAGRVAAVWAGGSVQGASTVGGLVGAAQAGSTIVASYATTAVACTGTGASDAAGGLAASNAGTIDASYSTGAVTGACPSAHRHGLTSSGAVARSYWDTRTSGLLTSGGGLGQTTSALRSPTSATGSYAGWDSLDLDGDGDPSDAPWDFGTNEQYPALSWRGMDAAMQRGDYDDDDDGLIDVRSLAQLNAVRWDLDGEGAPAVGNAASYGKAFRNHRADMGCPEGCSGYELLTDLDFDTDGDGSTHTDGAGDSDDAYYNGGAGFEPIGDDSGNRYSADFNGNGHVLANLFINRGPRHDTGLFGGVDVGKRIEALGLPNAYVRGNNWVGVLAGSHYGTIAACYATGQVVSAGGRTAGGLVGFLNGAIVAAYSTASVSGGDGRNGGLAGMLSRRGSVVASYAVGPVSQLPDSGGLVGILRLNTRSAVTASYWDTTSSTHATSAAGAGKTTAELQGPTAYTGIFSSWDDIDVDGDRRTGRAADADDDAWAFGESYQYPALKFAGFDTDAQFAAQPDIAPVFGTLVEDQTYRNGHAIAALQIPAASGGNGAISYSASGLPVGLSFDADGTGDCSSAHTICGTPTMDGASTVTVTATDGDPNAQASDQATLTFTITVATPTAAISATSPAALAETNLDNAIVTVTLTNTAFADGVTTASFTLTTDVPGLSVGSVATVSAGDASATLTLDYDGSDFDTARTLAVTVVAAAHTLAGGLTTATVAVTPGVGVRVSPPSLSVHEDPAAGGATNANQGSYTLVLESQPPGNVTVTATSADAAVQIDTDSTPLVTTLTFTTANWNSAQTVTAAAQQDDDGADESVSVTHSVTGYPGVTAVTTVTVAVDDDETAAVVIDTDPVTTTVDESDPLALTEATGSDNSKSYTVRLGALPTQEVTVTITSSDPSAVAVGDTDGNSVNGVQNTLTFTPSNWDMRRTVTLTAAQDADGVDESVTITNAASTASTSEYTNLSAAVTAMVDDDETPGFVFDAVPATPGVDDAGPVQLTEDDAADASKSYSVRLAAQPTQDVTVTITSADANAVAVDDPESDDVEGAQTLTFTTTDWSIAQTVTLTAQGDADAGDENVAITHAASTATTSEYTDLSADLTATVDDDETRGVVLSATSLPVAEQDSATYEVKLLAQPVGSSVTVTITGAGDGIAADTSGAEGIQTTLTFTTANWNTERTVTVTAAKDDNGINETVMLTHTPTGADYGGVAAAMLTVRALDGESPGLLVSTLQLMVDEGTSATYDVRLNTEPSASVTVTVSGTSGALTVDTSTASGDQDMMTFTPTNWNRDQTVTVTAGEDDNGVDETLTLSHTASGGDYGSLGSIERPSVRMTTADNDTPAVLLDANPDTANVDEAGPLTLDELASGNNSDSYTVRLATEPSAEVTVTIASADANAVAVNDTDGIMNGVQNTLVFTSSTWDTAQTVTLTAPQDDDALDESEVVTNAASTASTSEYTGLSAAITATVNDDETPGFVFDSDPSTPATADAAPLNLDELAGSATNSDDYSVRLSSQPTQDVTVAVTSPDTGAVTVGASTLTFTTSNWRTAQTVTATAAQDLDGADESVDVSHAAGTATTSEYTGVAGDFEVAVDDDETPAITLSPTALNVNEQDSAAYTVALATQPTGAVTVAITGAGSGISANPTSLAFTSTNWATARTVSVSAVDDQNSANEQVTLTHTAAGAAEYDTLTADLEATALDNDTPSLRVDPTALTVPEADSRAYTVRLNTQPSATVTVTVSGAGSGVTVDTDGATGDQNTLTFTAMTWETEQTVTVSAAADDNGVDEAVSLSHAAAGGDYGALTGAALPGVSVTADDDDTPAVLLDADPTTDGVDEAGPLALQELASGSNSDAYTVRLATEPTEAVTVTVTSSDTGAVTVGDTDGDPNNGAQNTLTFTAMNWDTRRTVTVAAAQDDDGVDEEAVVTNAASTAGMSEYGSLSVAVTVTVDDDETPGFAFDAVPSTPGVDDAGPLSLDELPSSGTNSASYTVRLATEPKQTVTVTVTSDDTGAVSVGDTDGLNPGVQNTLTFTSANWSAPQAVALTAQQDDDGADESVDIGHAAATASNSEYMGVSADFGARVDDDETPGITLSPASLTVGEQDSSTYTVVLDTEPAGGNGRATVTVTGAADGITASPTRLVFSASNWDTALTVRVRAADDQNSVNEVVTLSHAGSGADYGGVSKDLEVTAQDDDTPSLRVRPTSLTVREDGSATYRIRLNTEPSAAVTVTVGGTTAEVTVDADRDATGDQTSLTFTDANWRAERTVAVSAAPDDDATDEMVGLTHAASGGDYTGLAIEARPGVSVTVDDDDEPAVLIDADPGTLNEDEPGPLALNELSGHPDNSKGYTVRLATEPTATVEVAVTSGDRAVSVDADQTPLSRTLTFTALNWSAAQTVTATAAEDPDASNERVEIAHAADGGDYGGVSARLFATTVDDDEPALVVDVAALTAAGVAEGGSATYTVRLETEPAGVAVVSIAVTGGVSVDADGDQAGLQRSLRFDAANWNVARTVLVRGLEDDDAAAGAAALRHTSSGADYGRAPAVDVSFAVNDDDTPAVVVDQTAVAVNEGASAAYLVMLATAPSGGAVTVALSSSDAAAATVSPTVLRFTAGDWERPRRVTVRGEPDGDSTDGSATVSHSVSGGDYGAVAASPVAVAVRDSEAAGVRVEPPRLTVREGGTGRYRVRLNTEPTGDVTVTATGGAELAVDSDETPQERALTFTTENWGSERTVTVEAARDDGAEDGSLTVAHAVSGYAGVATAPALQVQVEDGDEPGFTFDPEGGLSLSEEPADPADAMGAYSVRLATQPAGAVAVEVASDDAGVEVDTDGTPRTLSLSFDASNWATGQSVSVRAVADADEVGETASLLHTAAGGGYGGVSGTLRVRVSDDDRPPAPPPPPPPPPENRPPVVVGSLADLDLDVGKSASVRLGGVFADDGPLSHWAESSDGAVASARVEGNSMLRVSGLSPGAAVVTVWAADVEGQRAQLSFRVSVGRVLSFDPASASAPEGGTLRLRLSLSRPAGAPLSVSWTALPDGDAATADADAADVSALSGTAEFAAGRTEAFIDLEVREDSEIEPAREVLRVELSPPPEGANWALGRSWALLWVEEGVCDRSPAVRDALRGSRECSAPTSSDLSGRGYLGLHRLDLPALRPKDFLGLSGLRVLHLHGNLLPELPAGLFEGLASLQRLRLDGNRLPSLPEGMLAGLGRLKSLRLDGNRLSELPPSLLSGAPNLERLDLGGNRLESLPPDLFAGAANLDELNLAGNPGAPFALVMRLVRTDAEPWEPSPAWVSARVEEGAPFAFTAALLAENAEPSTDSASVPAGAVFGAPMSAAQEGPGAARLSLADGPALPATLCGDVQDGRRPCFRGLSVQAGPALLLFKPPPSPTDEPPTPALSADGDRASLALDGLFSPAEAGDRLTYEAESNRPDLLSVRIADGRLVLEANENGDEGTAVVTVTATDPDGPSATLSLTVTVEFARVGAAPSWRLEWLRALRDADQ